MSCLKSLHRHICKIHNRKALWRTLLKDNSKNNQSRANDEWKVILFQLMVLHILARTSWHHESFSLATSMAFLSNMLPLRKARGRLAWQASSRTILKSQGSRIMPLLYWRQPHNQLNSYVIQWILMLWIRTDHPKELWTTLRHCKVMGKRKRTKINAHKGHKSKMILLCLNIKFQCDKGRTSRIFTETRWSTNLQANSATIAATKIWHFRDLSRSHDSAEEASTKTAANYLLKYPRKTQ